MATAQDDFALWYEEDSARLEALAKLARDKGYTVKLFKGKKTSDGADAQPSGRSLWQSKVRLSGWAEARSLTISIDFDRTFAADPKLWGEFAKEASDSGNKVVMITRREDTEKDRAEIESTIGDYADAFDSVILAGGKTQKEAAAKQAGIKVDIWIDDSPQTIKSRAYCATGAGGGIDNSCSSREGGGGLGQIPAASSLTRVKSLGGSTGAALMRDEAGNQYVVKGGNSPEHIRSEAAANAIYQAAGVRVPEFYLDEENPSSPKQVARFVEAVPLAEASGSLRDKAVAELQKGFAVDALLANWDVIGLEEDNVLVTSDGKAYRADNGGSLRYRAQGAAKPFGREVGELDTLRESDQGAPIFGDLTNDQVASQIRRVVARREPILRATPEELRGVISSRIDYMEEWANNNQESRAFCATGDGGGIDNSCSSKDGGGAGGDDEGGSAGKTKEPFSGNDASASREMIKTEDGREIPVVDRSDVTNTTYIDEIEMEGEDRGLVTDFDNADELQMDTVINEEYGPYAAFVGDAYGYFTGQGSPDGAETIDMYGAEYGTIDSDSLEQLAQDNLDEMWKGSDPHDHLDMSKEEWDALGSDAQEEKITEWRDENYSEAMSFAEQAQEDARQSAAESMKSDLESDLARATLDCCIQLYRGLTLDDSIVQSIIDSGEISHEGPNSWTTSRSTARQFGGSDVLLVCRNPTRGHVNQSDNLDEKEITRPPSTMKIVGVVKTSSGTVLYVEEDEDYVEDGGSNS